MGCYCFVPGCRSGNKLDGIKRKKEGLKAYSMFRPPKNAEDFYKWEKIIARADRRLTRTDHICELHFKEEDILRFFETKMPEGYIHKIQKGRPTLRRGALPVISSNPSKKTSSRMKRKPVPPKITMVLKTKTDFSEVITIDDTASASHSIVTQSDNPSQNFNEKSNIAPCPSDFIENPAISSDDETNSVDDSLPAIEDTLCHITKGESEIRADTFDGEDVASPDNSNISTDSEESITVSTLKDFWRTVSSRENERKVGDLQTRREFSFEFLAKNLDQVKKPSQLWALNSMPDYIICAKWDQINFTAEKRLVIDRNLCVKVFLRHVEILSKLNVEVKIGSFQDLSNLLLDVRDFILCAGIDNISPNKDCLMYIGTDDNSRFCVSCRKVKKKLRKRKTVAEWKKSMSQINEKWRSRAVCNERRQLRLQQKVDRMHKEIVNLRMKWVSANRQIERQKKIISSIDL